MKKLSKHDTHNFAVLYETAKDGQIALVKMREKKTGEYRKILCAVQHDGPAKDCKFDLIPFAIFFDSSPYDLYDQPTAEDVLINPPEPIRVPV